MAETKGEIAVESVEVDFSQRDYDAEKKALDIQKAKLENARALLESEKAKARKAKKDGALDGRSKRKNARNAGAETWYEKNHYTPICCGSSKSDWSKNYYRCALVDFHLTRLFNS
jgi:hypothetical protein